MSPDGHRLQIGSLLNARYAVLGYLGGGGFGQVYRGQDVIIGREVAIKVLTLPAAGLDAEAREGLLARFRREAQVSAQLHHPNVITIHDIGITEDDQGDPFLVMQLLQGHDLYTELTQRGPMTPARAQRLFLGCLDALGAAHAQGIVHKDLKPENLFIHQPGTPREALIIFDFGISHILQDARLTVTGQMIGTPGYMAPEYILRQEVRPALDVYQMGLIFAEAITGRAMVYDEDPLVCFTAHQRGDLWLPQRLADSPLGAALARALAPSPAHRFADASAFHDALLALPLEGVRADGPLVPLRSVVAQHALPFLSDFPDAPTQPPADARATVQATPQALGISPAGGAATAPAPAHYRPAGDGSLIVPGPDPEPAQTRPHDVAPVDLAPLVSLPPGGLTIPPSQPPATSHVAFRAQVDAEQATTRRWGFLLITGILGLLGLILCPLASVTYMGLSWLQGDGSEAATSAQENTEKQAPPPSQAAPGAPQENEPEPVRTRARRARRADR